MEIRFKILNRTITRHSVVLNFAKVTDTLAIYPFKSFGIF